jgi:hypothetical protein
MSTVLADPLPNILTVGSLNLLAGASGIGKTALIAGLARAFRDGGTIFGHAVTAPPAVGYVTADRPWSGTQHWFSQVGFGDIRHYSLVDDHSVDLKLWRRKDKRTAFFGMCVDQLDLPRGSLLIVDPIALFLGGNLIDYDAVAFACIELHRYLQDHEYCCIGVCHAAKQKSSENEKYARLQDRINGSGALLGYTGTQMYLAPPEETGESTYTFVWNPHCAPAELFSLSKGPRGLFDLSQAATANLTGTTAVTITKAPDTGPPALRPDEYEELQAVYAKFLPGESLSVHTVVSAIPHSRATVYRRLKRLVELGYLVNDAKGLWVRPQDGPEGIRVVEGQQVG